MSEVVTNFSKYSDKDPSSFDKMSGSNNKIIAIVVIIVVVVVILYYIFSTYFSSGYYNSFMSMSGASGYQAVVLNDSNLNIYFGKIVGRTSRSIYLTNVFYIKANSTTGSKNSSSSPQYSLVHLTPTYSYGALDEMQINESNVLFVENLSSKSTVYSAILNYYKTHKN